MSDQLTNEEIEEMRGVCEGLPNEPWHVEAGSYDVRVKSPESEVCEVREMFRPVQKGQTRKCEHIATFDPPTVRRLLDAVEERNRLRERVEELNRALERELSESITEEVGEEMVRKAGRAVMYREALEKCRSLAREQVDPAVIGSLLATIVETADKALEGEDDD